MTRINGHLELFLSRFDSKNQKKNLGGTTKQNSQRVRISTSTHTHHTPFLNLDTHIYITYYAYLHMDLIYMYINNSER